MKISIDTVAQKLVYEDDGQERDVSLYSADAFAVLSRL